MSKQTLKNRQCKQSLQCEQTTPFYLPSMLSLTMIPLLNKVRPTQKINKIFKNEKSFFFVRPGAQKILASYYY